MELHQARNKQPTTSMDLSLFNHNKLQTYATQHQIDWVLLPREDEFLGEYVPSYNERLLWASGFSGSAGIAIIGQTSAHLFVDGRYTLQAADEGKDFEVHSLYEIWDWIKRTITPSDTVGLNLKLHTNNFVTKLKQHVQTVRHLDPHPVDQLWTDRPLRPQSVTVPHELKYSGESIESKLSRVRAAMAQNAEALYVHDPHDVAWVLNIRGQDLPYTPITLARALIWKNGVVNVFCDHTQISDELRSHLGKNVQVYPESDLEQYLIKPTTLQIDPAASAYDRDLVFGKDVVQSSPISLMKAIKNSVEIEGMRKAHHWDGEALRKFREWLYLQEPTTLSEIKAADQLEIFRRESPYCKGLSFASISGFGSNGAIVHYHSTEKSNRQFESQGLYLIDSGGQYLEGTTDITRVFAIGIPTDEQRKMYTLVLKGHLRLAMAVFPKGTTGHQLDVLARYDLWQHGLNYDHGTGHGVGSYLSVHEGPQGISPRVNTTPLQPGMVVSNEPGYYKAGEYGIRIENMMVVQESTHEGYLCFETLTQVPYEESLIDVTLLTDAELQYLNLKGGKS
ncbi:MAG: M24 family metallopeptidase [Alphaproteobacteria bacterium]|nr:M24 family metallopeptidase [Alphaproteobacteria bacterium]